jgi:arylsulfatase A-like enzyme
MNIVYKKFNCDATDEAARLPRQGPSALLRMTLWFGLLAGWLELGLLLAQGAVNPRVSVATLRTNRHFVWMIPVSDLLIFSVVGLSIALLATYRRALARWIGFRLPAGMFLMALFLGVEGLHAIASTLLACGLAWRIGPWLERRAAGFGRIVRVSFPAMAVSMVVMTGLSYERVSSAEHRALSACPPAKPGVPNVLLIVLDTVRAASLSLHGHEHPTTPNLERLARQGIVFTEARSTAPWTTPTHASMMTGRWPHELSAAPGVPLDATFPTLAEVLAREGYATAGFVGNIYYCNALYGIGRGFARYEDAYENQTVSLFETVWSSGLGKRIIQLLGYPTQLDDGVTLLRKTAAMLNRDVLGWLAGRPAGQPFFVFINYYDAHRPYVIHADPEQRFGMAALPLADQLEIDKRFLDLSAGKLGTGDLSHEQIANDGFKLYHDSYDSCIAYLDRQLGLLLDAMDRSGSLENTLVIVTSDHGEQIGEHGMIVHGASLYRPEVHVPLLVIPPSRSSTARIVNEPVSLREIPATIAEWVDLGSRNPFPGRSLTRFLDDGTERPQEASPVLCELQHNIAFPETGQIPFSFCPVSSLVWRDRTYIRFDDGREELYDLLYDPLESFDLAKHPQSRAVIDRFREELSRLRGGMTNPDR